ncbi:MAG: DUF2868 domain-containing protein [Gammaproteobacteria bacterium]
MSADQSITKTQNIYLPLLGFGVVLGIIFSAGILSGDSQGRVNLLYLLILYFLLPVLSLVASIIAIIRGNASTVFSRLLHSSFFSIQTNDSYRRLRHLNLGSLWIMEQIQLFMMAFSLAGLMTFFVLLLVTDVTIIWRSTILTADDLYPVLSLLATPWQFWSAAQPSIDALQASQDYRILNTADSNLSLVVWWPYVTAVQITYAIIPRLIIYLGLKIKLSNLPVEHDHVVTQIDTPSDSGNEYKALIALSEVPTIETFICWDKIPPSIINKINISSLSKQCSESDSWQPELGQYSVLIGDTNALVIVKSWEAPMAELADQLKTSKGYLLLLNWRDEQLIPALDIHIDEWRRFSHSHEWQCVTLDDHYYE